MIITVPKIGDGTEVNPFRPNTTATWWQVVEERETEFVIDVIKE